MTLINMIKDVIENRIIIFLAGAFTGGIINYYVIKFTDKRKVKEANRNLMEAFENTITDMPTLINEMYNDLTNVEGKFIRDLVLLPSKGNKFNGEDIFIYYEEEHDKLSSQIKLLEQRGFVTDVTFNNTLKYRMTEEFVKLVLNSQ